MTRASVDPRAELLFEPPSLKSLPFIVNHVLLPPELPQKDDESVEDNTQLIELVLATVQEYQTGLSGSDADEWNTVVDTVEKFLAAHQSDALQTEQIEPAMKNMGKRGYLVFHIKAQNSAIIVHTIDTEKEVTIETFEVSPENTQVLAAKDRLKRVFPDSAASLPSQTFFDTNFLHEFAKHIAQLSSETSPYSPPLTRKAGVEVKESRDTIRPDLVTHNLVAILEANGKRVSPTKLVKRTRDDVLWCNAEKPWRRSPLWLVMRVALQRCLLALFGEENGTLRYKILMALLIANVCYAKAQDGSFPPDLLLFGCDKLSRRLKKIESPSHRFTPALRTHFRKVLEYVRGSAQRACEVIRERSNAMTIPTIPDNVDAESLVLSLKNSGEYLDRVLNVPLKPTEPALRTFSSPVRHKFQVNGLPDVDFGLSGFDLHVCLVDFESWVKLSLFQWLEEVEPSDDVCSAIYQIMRRYASAATAEYTGNAYQMSIMMLTTLELWCACDELTWMIVPLGKEYSPGIPSNFLESACLATLVDHRRLKDVEEYLQYRHHNSIYDSIFRDPDENSFACRFFDQSKELQDLRDHILHIDQQDIKKHTEKWRLDSQRYNSLQQQADALEHEYKYVWSWKRQREWYAHDRNCRKCTIENEAAGMEISVHESPLPEDSMKAKAAIFALRTPLAFSLWLDATWWIMHDLGRVQNVKAEMPQKLLRNYNPLRDHGQFNNSRIALASTTKSFLVSHYGTNTFPVALEDICVPNGLTYRYWDSVASLWMSDQAELPRAGHHFTSQLPDSSLYEPLRSVVDHFGHDPNSIIANQSKCPIELSLAEYHAFQEVRSRLKLQWEVMLRELALPNINFSNVESYLLFSHAALQVGSRSSNDEFRDGHWQLRDEGFCLKLIKQLEIRFESIETNWAQLNCMYTIVILLLCVASHSPSKVARTNATKLIDRIKVATFSWVGQLQVEADQAQDETMEKKFTGDALLAAILCRRTFEASLSTNQFLKARDVSIWVECAILINNKVCVDLNQFAGIDRIEILRDRKLAISMEQKLLCSIQADNSPFVGAINKIWLGTRSFSEWQTLDHPNERWITAIATSHNYSDTSYAESHQQVVHYNLLDGTLLVDGSPKGRLPDEFANDAAFCTLFGKHSFKVNISSLPGMKYVASTEYKGYEIHFGQREGKLCIRIRRGATIMEFVPPSIFMNLKSRPRHGSNDFPLSLIKGCVHWLDLISGVLHITPLKSCWEIPEDSWRVKISSRTATYRKSILVDPQSTLCSKIASLLSPLEQGKHIVVYLTADKIICVDLPRGGLKFVTDGHGSLFSHELGAAVDKQQAVGTFYGLVSKLVFRKLGSSNERFMLVPRGSVQVERDKSHVRVYTFPPRGKQVTYCKFSIDSQLGQLSCRQDPRDIYFKALLHAVTSMALPDALTGRTGTNEALHILKSGYSKPWMPLNQDCVDILSEIAELTPEREYYPRQLTCMQRISWDSELPISSQHDDFRLAVDDIIARSQKYGPFHGTKDVTYQIPSRGEIHLLDRATVRNFSACDDPKTRIQMDAEYKARDCQEYSKALSRVFEIASLVKQWSSNIEVSVSLIAEFEKLRNVAGFHQQFQKTSFHDLFNLDFSSDWGPLFHLCQNASSSADKAKLMFLLPTIAFGKEINIILLRTVMAAAFLEDMKDLVPPEWPSYVSFKANKIPDKATLLELIEPHCSKFHPPEDWESMTQTPKGLQEIARLRTEHQEGVDKAKDDFLKEVLQQWPNAKISERLVQTSSFLNRRKALSAIEPMWLQLFQNHELALHLAKVQSQLSKCCVVEAFVRPPMVEEIRANLTNNAPQAVQPGLSDLLQMEFTETGSLDCRPIIGCCNGKNSSLPSRGPSHESKELASIIDDLIQSDNTVHRKYGLDLRHSLNSWESLPLEFQATGNSPSLKTVKDMAERSKGLVSQKFNSLKSSLNKHHSFEWLQYSRLWPCITTIDLLGSLRESNSCCSASMRNAIVEYSCRIFEYQRWCRLERALSIGNKVQFEEEHRNKGFEDWDPYQIPEWNLLQIEANITIRPDQVKVAKQMIWPTSGTNTALQLNMGKGKSSVIIPMVMLALTNSKTLARVIVPKPLLFQMAQILGSRLGGLLNRDVFHLPFSRATPTDYGTIRAIQSTYEECIRTRGVLLTLHEHILSFKLSSLERLSNHDLNSAIPMMETREWLDVVSRDVLDECDSILSVQTQLVYPIGRQTMIDGNPNRWRTIQTVLAVTQDCASKLSHKFPGSISVSQRRNWGYPEINIIRSTIENTLNAEVARQICAGAGQILPVHSYSKSDLDAIEMFITNREVASECANHILEAASDLVKKEILVLRGLLAYGVLTLILIKRWNVQYGAHPDRCLIAVPYQAKGIPSPSAEFGHPDVAIGLTYLSYYYSGLSMSQFKTTLELILNLDDPSCVFDEWVRCCPSLPLHLQSHCAINLDDELQLQQLWTHLGYTTTVVDQFLNHVVFPKEARAFEKKLVASAWDILLPSNLENTRLADPALEAGAESLEISPLRPSISTGFSGTHDFKDLLPLSIKQRDLDSLAHTDVEPLIYLLQPRNRNYKCIGGFNGGRISVEGLLKFICEQKTPIRVFLDAGAQILEMKNFEFAKLWLSMQPNAPGVIYFDDADKLMILYPEGRVEQLEASPYASDNGMCLVYLDEAHCRGTDLKIAADARAALTIGPGQTKDHTVQAAMRMRQLAHRQSIQWLAPPEVHQSILDLNGLSPTDKVSSLEVIKWILHQSCRRINQLQPLYFSHGLGYCQRGGAYEQYARGLRDKAQTEMFLKAVEQPESLDLEELYGVKVQLPSTVELAFPSDRLERYNSTLLSMRAQLDGYASLSQTTADEEQHRELAVEVEEEVQVQRPNPATPLQHFLSPDVVEFVRTGIVRETNAYTDAFAALQRTAIANMKIQSGDKLLATKDFLDTVKTKYMDEYQRPVNWILWSRSRAAIVISPFEAEELLDELRVSKKVYMIIYAAPVSVKMLHFEKLTFRSIPPLPSNFVAPVTLVRALRLFSGGCFFPWKEYAPLCKYLGLSEPQSGVIPNSNSASNGKELHLVRKCTRNPLRFLRKWTTIRRKGEDFSLTPIGYLCEEKALSEGHRLFPARGN